MTTTTSYWKMGSGSIFDGGCVGAMSTHTEGDVEWSAGYPAPAGAVDITAAEYDAIIAAMTAEWPAEAQAVADSVADARVLRDTLFAAAIANLVAGLPLSAAEAESLGAH